LKAAAISLTRLRASRTLIATARRWPAAIVLAAIVRLAEIVADAVDGRVAAGEIVDAAGAVDGLVAVGGIVDAAGRAGDDTRTFCHGFSWIKQGHDLRRGLSVFRHLKNPTLVPRVIEITSAAVYQWLN